MISLSYNVWTQEQRDFVAAHGADCDAFEAEFGLYRTAGALQGKMPMRDYIREYLSEDIYDG